MTYTLTCRCCNSVHQLTEPPRAFICGCGWAYTLMRESKVMEQSIDKAVSEILNRHMRSDLDIFGSPLASELATLIKERQQRQNLLGQLSGYGRMMPSTTA